MRPPPLLVPFRRPQVADRQLREDRPAGVERRDPAADVRQVRLRPLRVQDDVAGEVVRSRARPSGRSLCPSRASTATSVAVKNSVTYSVFSSALRAMPRTPSPTLNVRTTLRAGTSISLTVPG